MPKLKCRDTDKLTLSPSAAYYVAFLEEGYSSDEATELAEKAVRNPGIPLEDIRLDTPRPMKL